MKTALIVFLIFMIVTFFYGGNINISQGSIFDGEPYLAVNPSNPRHIVIAWLGYIDSTRARIKTRVSFDAGNTWSNINLIDHVNPFYGSADPSLDFDNNGNVYLCYIDFNRFRFSGAVYVRKSVDGGLTWGNPVEVINAHSEQGKFPIDRPWISIDRSGGVYDGYIYVTTMNPTVFGPLSPPYHPYLTVSADGGNSFGQWSHLDTLNWLAGNFIPQPMPTPSVSSDGTFNAVYPSLVFTQNSQSQFILVSSNDGGNSFAYHSVFSTPRLLQDSVAKKGYLLRTDPSNADHRAFFYIDNLYGDFDIFMRESFDKGATLSEGVRINDDPIGNNRMQDLLWADFDTNGDLAVSWRDRRNGADSTYSTSYEIWGAVRLKNSADFFTNFRISDTLVAYDSILARSGNDFMSVKLMNDTLNAAWGDTRDGRLNIWFQRMAISQVVTSIDPSSGNKIGVADKFLVYQNYPNPFNPSTTISYDLPRSSRVRVIIYDVRGDLLKTIVNGNQSAGRHSVIWDGRDENGIQAGSGIYFYRIISSGFSQTRKMLLIK